MLSLSLVEKRAFFNLKTRKVAFIGGKKRAFFSLKLEKLSVLCRGNVGQSMRGRRGGGSGHVTSTQYRHFCNNNKKQTLFGKYVYFLLDGEKVPLLACLHAQQCREYTQGYAQKTPLHKNNVTCMTTTDSSAHTPWAQLSACSLQYTE